MAMKHRKLFPSLTDQANETTTCVEFCTPNCPSSCDPDPTLYLSPPPPPPPPRSPHLSPHIIIAVSVLAALLFLLASYFIISNIRRRSPPPPPHPDGPGDDDEEEAPPAAAVDHPVWYIATVGLQQATINSIAACIYRKGEGLIDGTECSVCLGEFREGDALRLLPKCSHAFHIPCIDTWLRSHTSCPLCRAPIVSNNPANRPLGPADLNNQDPGLIEEDLEGYGGSGRRRRAENSGFVEEESATEVEESDAAAAVRPKREVCDKLHGSNQVRRALSMDHLSNQKSDLEAGSWMDVGSSSMEESTQGSPCSLKRSWSCGSKFFGSRLGRGDGLNSIIPW